MFGESMKDLIMWNKNNAKIITDHRGRKEPNTKFFEQWLKPQKFRRCVC